MAIYWKCLLVISIHLAIVGVFAQDYPSSTEGSEDKKPGIWIPLKPLPTAPPPAPTTQPSICKKELCCNYGCTRGTCSRPDGINPSCTGGGPGTPPTCATTNFGTTCLGLGCTAADCLATECPAAAATCPVPFTD